MQFNSLVFVAFLIVVVGLYHRLRSVKAQNVWLLLASYLFYGWWDYRFLALIGASTLVDFWCGQKITAAPEKKKRWLLLSLALNLGSLGFFKYFNFFIDSAASALEQLGLTVHLPALEILLPVGISFYTFQTLSYTIDIYRGKLEPIQSLTDFALFVSFFPQLVAGPVERAAHLLPQIQSPRVVTHSMVADGLWLILLGFTKKLVIADRLGTIADLGFSHQIPAFQGAEGWIFLVAFAFQIYGDFSAYSDIARGSSKLLGFDLMVNFRAPYWVTNPSDFWHHWHISLSTWLRDYLYIPLGGNRGPSWFVVRNLLLTMILGGLWHGAGWAFLIWGAYHGLLLAIHRSWRKRVAPSPLVFVRVLAWASFSGCTLLGWLFFRLGNIDSDVDALALGQAWLVRLFSAPGHLWCWQPVLVLGALGMAFQYFERPLNSYSSWGHTSHGTAAQIWLPAFCLLLICTLGVFDGATFIYFQF